MHCSKCGFPLDEGSKVCKNCGKEVENDVAFESEVSKAPIIYTINAKRNPLYALCGGLVLAAVAVILTAAVMLSIDNSINFNEDNENNTVVKTAISAYKVDFKGFTFTIPDSYIYEVKENSLLVSDTKGTWTAQIELQEGSFEKIKENMNLLQIAMQRSGFTSTMAVEKTLGDINYITFEINKGGQNAVAGITDANSMYFMAITVTTRNNDFDYSVLANIAPIVKSIEYNGITQKGIVANDGISLIGISEYAK